MPLVAEADRVAAIIFAQGSRTSHLPQIEAPSFGRHGSRLGIEMHRLLICAGLALAGCQSNTGAVALGNGELMVTTQSDIMSGGLPAAQQRAIQTAMTKCASEGMQMAPGDTTALPIQPFVGASFILRFRCVQRTAGV